jgi:hypothetical protein
MPLVARLGLAILLAIAHAAPALARDEAPPAVAPGLVAFASDDGLARLARASAKVDFPALANQFEAQTNSIFCGPTTAAIVLNTLRARSPDLPRDRSRLRAEDLRNISGGFDPVIPRFTQDNVITRGSKTRAQVMGEPMTLNGKQIRDFGYQVRQIDELFKAHALRTRLVIVDDRKSEQEIRTDLVENLKRRGDYVVVNYWRQAVGQQGGGHISPLAAYDPESDSFLVLDVNPASAGWVWMPATNLVKGMRTFDKVENRGYIHVESR